MNDFILNVIGITIGIGIFEAVKRKITRPKTCENCMYGDDAVPRSFECPLDEYWTYRNKYDPKTFSCSVFKKKVK